MPCISSRVLGRKRVEYFSSVSLAIRAVVIFVISVYAIRLSHTSFVAVASFCSAPTVAEVLALGSFAFSGSCFSVPE